ncbi:MAG: methionyl-tRNA formyltransferase [Patescibacteria group bacterium]|nr:methionyl-tRNA formyltransferase [Patescibacteria group bacterium]
MKFIFFGTPEFSVIVLKQLLKQGLKPSLVVTTEDKPVGRKQKLTAPPLKLFAKKNSIPLLQLDGLYSNMKEKLQADLFVVAAYGNILPKAFLNIPAKGVLNVHPSLLPKYRGPSPIHTAILNGDKETGVSIILLDEKMDHGPILYQEIYEKDISSITTPELTKELAVLGGKLLSQTIVDWMNNAIEPIPQDDKNATFTKMIQKKDGLIDFNNTAQYIERQIRAYAKWPSVYYFVKDKEDRLVRIKIIKAHVSSNTKKKGVFYINAKDGLLVVDEVQIEGKKVMSGEDFMRGYAELLK